MSNAVMQVNEVNSEAVITHLSEEFRQVVERIQGELRDMPLGGIDPEAMAPVDAAERTVDALAQDLQQGVGDRSAWQSALLHYESAWREVIRSLGERRN